MDHVRDIGAELGWTPQQLRAVEFGKHKTLLGGIMRLAVQRDVSECGRALIAPYRFLSAAETRAPDAVADVIASPQFGAWANDALRCLLDDSLLLNGIPRATGLGRLALFAATAAIRARLPFDLAVPLQHGLVSFPALGTALLGTGPEAEWGQAWRDGSGCHVRSRSSTVDVPGRNEPARSGIATSNWAPLAQVSVMEHGLCLNIVLDHGDPFLDRYGPALRRTADLDLVRWRHLAEAGWRTLSGGHRMLATVVSTAIRAVVPLVAPTSGRVIGGTEESSFGAIAMSLPPDALSMAETLVHESHHAVLGALRDIEPLTREDEPGQERSFRGYAPWRDDPRPAHALLQGIYAHYGMGQFWRREYLTGAAAHRERAALAFGRMRVMTARGVRSLGESGLLTEAGRRILASIDDEVTRWHGEPLPAAVERQASEVTRQHEARWRERWPAVR